MVASPIGFRGRLFGVSLLLMALFAISMGGWLELSMRPSLATQQVDELQFAASSVDLALQRLGLPGEVRAVELQRAIEDLSQHGGVRITVLDPAGEVVADSAVGFDVVADLAWHGDRPEVIAAHASGSWGQARRPSSTLGQDMLYVARVVDWSSASSGTLRIARTAERVDAPVNALYRVLVVALVGGLAVALFMTGLAANLMHRDLGLLLRHTAALAGGEKIAPLRLHSSVELAGIAGKVDQMSHEMQGVVRALAEERSRSAAVLGTLREGLLSVDPDGRLTLVNAAGTRLVGLSTAQLGQRVADSVDNPLLIEMIDLARSRGEAGGDVVLPMPDDPERSIIVQARIRVGETGDSVVSLRDVSHLRALETMRRDFVANVSHELRTPVSIVQASAEALQDGAIDDPRYAAQFLDAILRNTERLRLLTKDILQLSRIEAGHTGVVVEAVDVSGLVDDVLEILQLRAASRDQSITSTVSEGVDVLADAGALEQVLVNLLENALKYTPEGQRIEVGAARRGRDRVRIFVADTGPGIPERHRSRIFERFYRVDSGRSRNVGGTGLGLAIVKHLAESMDGAVGVDANQPTGSVFWLELPEAPPLDPPSMEAPTD